MANYYTHFSTVLELKTIEQGEKAIKLYNQLMFELEEGDNEPIQFSCDLDKDFGADKKIVLWFHTEESGSPSQLADFVLELGREFKLKGKWGFEYAETCSRPRIGAFGGGAAIVDFDKDEAQFLNTGTWLVENGVETTKV